MEKILVDGGWRDADADGGYRAIDPSTGTAGDAEWPVSRWNDIDAAIEAAGRATAELRGTAPSRIAAFLERYAARLEASADALVAAAHTETGLAVRPRLAEVELPRMLDQLRQAAASAREETWRMAMIDSARNIRSMATGLGPVVVFPPANFPFAYGAVTGGDFASAIAAGNPVIAKAHPGHPSVSRLAAEEAVAALHETGLPPSTVQLLHGVANADGERLVADSRIGGSAFTGSQEAGMRLFAAASAAGRVMWVEMGSINPVVLLPGAIAERGDEIVGDLVTSVTGSAGQFCTKPGVVFLVDDAGGKAFVRALADRFDAMTPQVLLGASGRTRLVAAIERLSRSGASVIATGSAGQAGPCTHPPTLLETTAADMLVDPGRFLVEAFGNATLLVRCGSLDELLRTVAQVHGSLGASLYAARDGRDSAVFAEVAPLLVERSGRVIENRMPTGLAVTPPMQHGGPWPSAGPPFFSAVGMPWSILRFARRVCYDGWSQPHLPEMLRDPPPPSRPWRFVNGGWSRG